MSEADNCANCGAPLRGAYCADCGQKRFVDADRRFSHMVAQFLHEATAFDSRFWGSVRALLFRPGVLSRDYLDGRRRRWMAPATLFLLANLAYFFAPTNSDFDLVFTDQVPGRIVALARDPGAAVGEKQRAWRGQLHSAFTAGMVDRRVAVRDAKARAASGGAAGYTYRDFRLAYDAYSSDVSKALIVLHVPFLALLLMLLFAGRRRYFAEHFVVALHYFTFTMCLALILVYAMRALHPIVPGIEAWQGAVNAAMPVCMGLYALLLLRRAYAVGWLRAFVAAVVLVPGLFAINLTVYRALQFLLTFALA